MPELVQIDIDGPVIEVVQRKRKAGYYSVAWRKSYVCNADYLEMDADKWVVPSLEPVLDDLYRRTDSKVFPIQVYLPDPLVRTTTLMLKEWPSKKRERDAYIAWQLGKRLSVDTEEMMLAYQLMGDTKEEKVVLATGVPIRLVAAINALFEKYHAMPEVVSVSSCLKFDALQKKVNEGSGALVLFWHGYWSIIIWDLMGRVRYQRSRWYSVEQDGAAFVREYFVFELERVIRGVMLQEKVDSVERIYVGGAETYVKPLVDALDAEGINRCSAIGDFSYINTK